MDIFCHGWTFWWNGKEQCSVCVCLRFIGEALRQILQNSQLMTVCSRKRFLINSHAHSSSMEMTIAVAGGDQYISNHLEWAYLVRDKALLEKKLPTFRTYVDILVVLLFLSLYLIQVRLKGSYAWARARSGIDSCGSLMTICANMRKWIRTSVDVYHEYTSICYLYFF